MDRADNFQPDDGTTADRFAVEELVAWVEAQRTLVAGCVRDRLGDEYSALRQEYCAVKDETRKLTGDRLLFGGQAVVLRRLAEAAASMSRLIDWELDRVTSESEAIVSPYVIGLLVDVNRELLARLKSQLQLIETIGTHADDLHRVVKKLVFAPRVSPARLQNLARRIWIDVKDTPSSRLLLPEPGLVIQAHLQERQWRSEPFVYATGIQTARLLAYAAGGMLEWTDRLELLTTAALLQDIGLLLLEAQHGLIPEQLAIDEPAAYWRHPSIGAALAAALRGYAVDLPLLIAQHHERCDGTGFPEGSRRDRLSAPSRFLAVAVRFVELTHHTPLAMPAKIGAGGNDDPYRAAAGRLRREAVQGELDRDLTTRFLERLGLDNADLHQASTITGIHSIFSQFESERFRRDEAHPELSGPRAASASPQQSQLRAPHFLKRAGQGRKRAGGGAGQPDPVQTEAPAGR